MSGLQILDAKARGVHQRKAQAIRSLTRGAETITAAATYSLPIGVVDVEGLILERFFVVTDALLIPDGTNYYTFKPWIYRRNALGTLDRIYLGTARTTQRGRILGGDAHRLHDEADLKAAAPPGATVGVDLVVTGTPATTARLVLPVFQADLYAR